MNEPIVEKTVSKKHLFQKGNKMSPGRTKGSMNMSTMLRMMLTKLNKGETLTSQEKILMSLVRQAEVGDLKAVEMVLDRVDGKPTQQVQQLNVNINPVLSEEQTQILRNILDE